MKLPVLFFDGDCLLCSKTVQWIIKNDKKGIINFCSLEDGRKAGIIGLGNDTVVLYYLQEKHQKSQAIAQVFKLLGGFYRYLGYIITLVPSFISNRIYDFVAKNRYRWFGRKVNCLIPDREWSHRILSREKLSDLM